MYYTFPIPFMNSPLPKNEKKTRENWPDGGPTIPVGRCGMNTAVKIQKLDMKSILNLKKKQLTINC